MKNNNNLIEYMRAAALFAFLVFFSAGSVMAQCFASFDWGGGTLDNNSTSPVNLASCAFADEYSPVTINSTGDYEFTSTVTTDFLTITDGSNTVITSGITPVTATITSTGSYRVHVHSDASCGTAGGCRDLNGEFVGGGSPPPPPSAGVYNFHPAGAVGRFGPTQAQVNTAYTGTSLDGEVTVTGSGIQNWVVPISGIYEIEALGAQGGGITGGSALNANGTEGARVQGEFVLTQGDTIKILVGQRAGTGLGGGGGSFVIAPPYTDTTSILAIAGGGGSEGSTGTPNLPPSESEGRSVRSGGTFSDITRAQAGQGGNVDTPNGGGGGGFLTDGGGTGGSGQSFLNGGVGASGQGGSYEGGFGGGGARDGSWGAGGGGGYSGGAASGSSSPRRAGGGGGSFNAGTNQINQAGVNTGDGEVRIELLVPLMAQDDAGVASIDSPGVFCPGPQDVVVTIQNFGTNQITSVDVNWEVNGVAQPSFTYTSTLDTIGGTGSNTAQINLGTFTFTNAAYNLVAWTSNPNNTADTTTFNDTATAIIQSSLPPPSGLSATNVTGASAFLNWTAGDPSNDFLYVVVPVGGIPSGGTLTSQDTVTVTGLSPLTDYEFYVREVCANGQDTSAWSNPEPFSTPFLCPANGYCFTNAGATGAFGPTQAEVDAEYGPSNSLNNSVTSSNGIQVWEVPTAGLYKITAYGAEGGFETGNNAPAGLGAMMSGEFSFGAGDTLLVLVGQAGEGVSSSSGGTGGGGSFVTYADSTPLVVAAGGSGAPNSTNFGELNGKITNRGPDGGSGHTSSASGGGGGGGFLTDGTNGSTDQTFNGRAFVNGGQGGTGTGNGGFGGGGGKGGTFNDGAGGGGYSGGDNTYDAVTYGGGGSFNVGVNQVNQEGVKEDHGIVIIEALPSPSCLFPANLNAVNVTSNSADLQWQENGSATLWDVEYGVQGFTQGNGTMVSATSNNPLAVTGLTQLTDYDFYVRSICGSGDTSSWVGPVSFQTPCPFGLSGTFTLGTSPADDFPDFQSAVAGMMQCGIAGPVHIDVQPGTYNEQIIIGDIPGSSATNTVTFKGADPATTILTYEQNQSDDRYTVRFDGSSYITFDSLTVEAQSSGTYGWVVHITDNTSDITMKNCSLLTDGNSTSTFVEGVIVSGSNTSYTTGASGVSNITLEDNYILGGYNGIRFNGNFGNEVQNVIIEGNHLDDSYYYGIYLLRNDGVTIENNTVDVRSTGTDFSAAIYFSSTDDYQIIGNTLRGMGRYGIYNTNGGGTSTNRAAIVNNAIGGGFRSNSTLTSGIRILNTSSQYIDIIHNSINVDQPSGRALNVSNTSPSNLRIWNNNLAHTPGSGTGYALYVSSTNSIEDIDYNNYYSDGSNFVYYGSARADLATLQGVNTPANNDANSVSADPLFLAFDHLLPLSNAIDNEGLGIPQIPIDIEGNPRDPNNPSIGAYEFVAPNGDIGLDEVRLAESQCLGSNDSIYFEVTNNLGSTIDFNSDPLTFTWEVTGPVNSNGVINVNSGSLAVGNSVEFGGDGVDMSVPGNYVITLAYIDTNAVNDVTANDTLINSFNVDIDPLLAVSPKIDTVYILGDSVELTAQSPFFPGGDFFITEICQWAGSSTGSPVGGTPSWLGADDYIEITGVPNSDLAGYTLEQWKASMDGTYTFPSGTVLGPNGTAVFAVGQLGSSVPSPSDFYYHANGTYTGSYGSGTAAGRILFDPSMNIVDAVGYNGYTFPAAANVPASEWANPLSGGGSSWGIRLEGPDDNTGNNWVLSANSPQDPNMVNQGVSVPVPGNLTGFTWNFQSSVIDTNVETTVGPFTVPGIYEYIAEYTGTPCGTLYDTSTIVVAFTDIDVVAANDPSCNQGADGQIEVTSLGGQAPFTYLWSDDPNRTGGMATGLVAGTYGVTVTDVNNVSDSTTITLTNPAQFPLSFNMTPSSCGNADGQLDVSINGGSSPYTYAWSSGGSAALETGLAGGMQYIVTVTDANGCVSIDSANVSDAGAPALTFNIVNDIDCATDTDGEVAVSVSGGAAPYSYNWSNSSTNATLSNVAGGNYSVTVTDSLGCAVVGSVSLNDPDTLEITSATVNNVTCNGSANGSIQIAVAGGTLPYSYNWSNNSNSPSISGLAPGTYSGTVTDANGCQIVGGPVTITEPSAPLTATVTNTVNVSCNGGSDGEGTVSASGGTSPYTYTWSNAGTGATQTGLTAGSYIVTITDDNNCQTLQSVNISQPSALQSVVLSSQDVSCNGGNDGAATAVAQGGTAPYTYTWSNASTGAMATGLSQGSYDVTVTDDNGCTSISSVVINEPTALTATISNTTDVTCFGANNGTATVTASGGTPGYTYAWSNNQGNPTANGLGAGSYDVTVTDANGCNTIVNTTISEPTALSATLSATHVSCNGGSDGELEAVVSGGTSPYSYNWSNGDTAAIADSLTAGLYLVTVSDANGCNTILSNFVNEPSALTASINISSEITCNGETDGEAMVNAMGGTAPYSYAWSNGDSTMNAADLGAGTVHVTITDANGCMLEDSVSLSEPDVLTVSIENAEDATCFGYANGRGEAVAQGGTMPYSYSWTSGTMTATANNLPSGTNEITVTDANGCMATATVEIEEPAQIDTSLVVENQGALIANLEGSDVTYQWWDCDAEEIVTGANGQYFEPESNGTYALIINEAGCQDTSRCFELTRVSAADLAGETNTFEVYPNPNRGHFNVRLTGNSESPVQLDVMDMQGKQLLSRNIGRLSGELTEELNINLASGVYFVKVIRDGEMSIKRVVVQ